MIEILETWFAGSVLVRLFVIIGLGYLLGDLRLPGNFRFGVAAVVFVGLAFGAWNPALALPEEIQQLGLVLFVYCIGLQAAAGFFQSFKREGLPLNAAMTGALLAVFGAVWLAGRAFGLPGPLAAGLFCGSLTNTAALGAAADAARLGGLEQDARNALILGYGLTYPVAILLVMFLIQARAVLRRDPPETDAHNQGALALTIEVTVTADAGRPWTAGELIDRLHVIFTRHRFPDGRTELVTPNTLLPPGRLVVAVGTPDRLTTACAFLGRESPVRLQDDLGGYELHRYFVSNKDIVGRPVREIGVEAVGGVISRLRRGDVDLPVTPDTALQLGDRVRVVSMRSREKEVRAFFGNSLTVLTETGYLSFAVGIVLGLVAGQVPLPVPGLVHPLYLGSAGGALVAGLVLGRFGRSGPFIWQLPYDVNLALRQLGILMFLACVGVKAGGGVTGLFNAEGLRLVLLAVAFITGGHLLLLALLHFAGRRATPAALGVMCGYQTQPAALTFAATHTDVGRLHTAYATVYPLALVLKIILAQLLVFL